MRKVGNAKRRARLLLAKAAQWLGGVWIVACWGYALLQLDLNQNLSDAIADATPLILLGGIGFAATYFVAWVLIGNASR